MKYRQMFAGIALSLVLFLGSPGGLLVVADKPTDKTDNVNKPVATTTGTAAGTSATDRKADQQAWLALKEAAKPYQEKMRANHKAFQALRDQLAIEVTAARRRVDILLSSALPEKKLLDLQAKIAELKELVVAVRADQGSLGQEMTLLRGSKTDLDLTAMIGSFDAAIAIQDNRIDLVTQSIETVKGICPD